VNLTSQSWKQYPVNELTDNTEVSEKEYDKRVLLKTAEVL
jgi:hypothetical protein